MAWFHQLTPAQIEQLPAKLQEQYRAKLASQNGCPVDLDQPIADPIELEQVRQWWNEQVNTVTGRNMMFFNETARSLFVNSIQVHPFSCTIIYIHGNNVRIVGPATDEKEAELEPENEGDA